MVGAISCEQQQVCVLVVYCMLSLGPAPMRNWRAGLIQPQRCSPSCEQMPCGVTNV